MSENYIKTKIAAPIWVIDKFKTKFKFAYDSDVLKIKKIKNLVNSFNDHIN